MYLQAGLFFYKFRLVFASLLTLAFLLLTSAVVTVAGSGTVLATAVPSSRVPESSMSGTPNAVTDAAASFATWSQRTMLSTGGVLYRSCRSITDTTAQSGRSIAHAGAIVASGVWSGTGFVARGFGGSVLFVLRIPVNLLKPVTHVSSVSAHAVVTPADDKALPVIDSETSAAVLAKFNTQQQEEIASWQAAQVVANRNLGGSVVAGDPHHGGYPVELDNAAQDSKTDNWGMYNRECVSYAAWKVYQTYSDMPYWGGVGNANLWVRNAKAAGIPTGSAPQVHSVAISTKGYYGHAAWVEAVKGEMIYVSQYNYDLHGHYSEMWVKSSNFTYIYFK